MPPDEWWHRRQRYTGNAPRPAARSSPAQSSSCLQTSTDEEKTINTKRLLISALGALVAAALVGAVAYATIPGPDNVSSACMLKGLGTIRLIDKSLPATNLMSRCTDKETGISWNQAGQPGPASDWAQSLPFAGGVAAGAVAVVGSAQHRSAAPANAVIANREGRNA